MGGAGFQTGAGPDGWMKYLTLQVLSTSRHQGEVTEKQTIWHQFPQR